MEVSTLLVDQLLLATTLRGVSDGVSALSFPTWCAEEEDVMDVTCDFALPYEPDEHDAWGSWTVSGELMMHAMHLAHQGMDPMDVWMHLIDEHIYRGSE